MNTKKTSAKFNYIYSSAYSILTMILPLITSPYISRVMGAEKLGIYTYTYSIANYFALFALLGLTNYGNRCIAKTRDKPDELNKTFSEIYSMQLLVSGIAVLTYAVYAIFVVKDNKGIFLIQFLMVFGTMINVNWFFFGLEQFKITVTRNFVIKIASFVSIFIFVKTPDDLWKYTLIMSLGTALSDGLLFLFLPKYVRFVRPKFKDVVKHIKPNIILFLPLLAVSFYRSMDKIMLKWLGDYSQVGYYSNSEKIINLCISLITALGQVMLPKMSNMYALGKKKESLLLINKTIKFSSMLCCAMACGIIAIASTFVPIFFGEGYEPCINILMLLAPNLLLLAIGNVLKTQYLIPNEHDSIYIASTLIGAVVNAIINSLLIPRLFAIGAVIGTLVAELVSLVFIMTYVRKDINPLKIIKDIVPYASIGIIMIFGVKFIDSILSRGVISLIVEICIGAFIYTLLTLIYWVITKDELLDEVKGILIKILPKR